jgi:NADH-quinone oxidoreductase subunit N
MLYYINFEIIIIFLILGIIVNSVLFESKIKNLFMFVSYPIAISIVTLVFSTCALYAQSNCFWNFKVLLFFDQYILDFYSTFAKFFLIFSLICILIFLQAYLLRYKQFFNEYLILILFAFLGLVIMVSSYDFLVLYLAIELQALSSYALAALRTDSRFSIEAGLKYFITGTVASIFFLLGVAFIYLASGTTNFAVLSHYLIMVTVQDMNPLLFYGITFVIVGLLAKLGAVPFHMWLLDVYQGSPLVITAFFSILPKIALVFTIGRLYYDIFTPGFIKLYFSDFDFKLVPLNFFSFDSYSLIFIVSVLSIFFGALGGLVQVNLKRLFAYSSITNIGFILLSISLGSIEAFHAALFYLITYIFLAINFFAILISIRLFTARSVITILDLTGIDSTYSLLLALNLFSMAGVPPLAGFFSKLYIYFVLVDLGYIYTSIFIVLISIFSVFFYIRIISNLFFRTSALEVSLNLFFYNLSGLKTNTPMLFEIIVLTSFFNFFFFFFVNTLSNLTFNLLFYLF